MKYTLEQLFGKRFRGNRDHYLKSTYEAIYCTGFSFFGGMIMAYGNSLIIKGIGLTMGLMAHLFPLTIPRTIPKPPKEIKPKKIKVKESQSTTEQVDEKQSPQGEEKQPK